MSFERETRAREPGLVEAVNREAAELIKLLRCSDAPDAALAAATAHLQQAMDVLSPYLRHGEGWSTVSIASDTPGLGWQEEDLTACMPYSPVSGKRNPVAPPLRMWRDGDQVRGEAIFSPTYAGPPNSVHGGIIAAVFDELLSMANVIRGVAGFTGTLTIKYHRRTPLNTPVELWAINERSSDRKQFSRGEFRVDGEVTASAEGLFICPAGNNDSP